MKWVFLCALGVVCWAIGLGCTPLPRVTDSTAALRAVSRSASPVSQTAGLADLAHLRMQTPLPETADEVCEVARSIGCSVAFWAPTAQADGQLRFDVADLKRLLAERAPRLVAVNFPHNPTGATLSAAEWAELRAAVAGGVWPADSA